MTIRKLGQYWAVIVNGQPLFTSATFPHWAVACIS